MKTFADLFPFGDRTIEAVAVIETMIDDAIEQAARDVAVAGSPFGQADGKIVVEITPTSPLGDRLEMTAWRHAAARYRAAGWSVTFATDPQARPVLLIAP
jgi:hypothetical protein